MEKLQSKQLAILHTDRGSRKQSHLFISSTLIHKTRYNKLGSVNGENIQGLSIFYSS